MNKELVDKLIDKEFSDLEILNILDKEYSDIEEFLTLDDEFSSFYETAYSDYESNLEDAFDDFLDAKDLVEETSYASEDTEYAAPLIAAAAKIVGSAAGRAAIGAGVGAGAGALADKNKARRKELKAKHKAGTSSEDEKSELKKLKSDRRKKIIGGALLGGAVGGVSKAAAKGATKVTKDVKRGVAKTKASERMSNVAKVTKTHAKDTTKLKGAAGSVPERATAAKRAIQAKEATSKVGKLKGAQKLGSKAHKVKESAKKTIGEGYKHVGTALGIAGTVGAMKAAASDAKEAVPTKDKKKKEDK